MREALAGRSRSVRVHAGVVRANLLSSAQVTDTYLVQLAVSLDARLATFDARIVTTAVSHAEGAVFLIP